MYDVSLLGTLPSVHASNHVDASTGVSSSATDSANSAPHSTSHAADVMKLPVRVAHHHDLAVSRRLHLQYFAQCNDWSNQAPVQQAAAAAAADAVKKI